jgi:hypothetical protein
MSAEKIEFVKPPVTPNRERKLAAFGSSLLLVGLLGLATVPGNASAEPSNARVDPSDSASVIWDNPTPAFSETTVDGHIVVYGYMLDIFDTSNGQKASAITSMRIQPGVTKLTFYSYSEIRPPAEGSEFGQELGAGSYVVEIRLASTVLDADGKPVLQGGEPEYVNTPVSSSAVLMLTVPLTERPAQNIPPTPTPSREVALPPAVDFEIQVTLPSNLLFSGNREFKFEASNMSEVTEMTVNGRPLPIVSRKKNSLKIRVPFLRPGSYNVTVSTETDSWVIPNAITIGELPANIKSEGLDESFLKFSSELPSQTKQEIRSLIEETPDLKSVTVFAIAKREIIGEDRNKLARSRAASAFAFIKRVNPEVRVRTEIIHYTEVELTSRGLFFKVAQKKQP